ncbi:16S rRNA (guanine(527)-N(7))-methyltransferase RsmG [candidate division CSSED10-310 bacterium]|uniref:Ribosomal RNA small subunit methyltransferase G n=1 Tax=candidate division CSSED10-310 bacterium TaxID=2855610 RepID=A0ABV6YVR1_UNCC1
MDKALDMLRKGLAVLNIPSSGIILDQFELYIEEIQKWSQRYRLVSKVDAVTLVQNHILDSLTVVPEIEQKASTTVLDIGSGAGFPGLCVKIALPDLEVTLLDSRQHRIEFLKAVIRSLGLKSCFSLEARLEEDLPLKLLHYEAHFDIILARGFASIPDIVRLTSPLLNKNGRYILHRGNTVKKELSAAQECIKSYGLNFCKLDESPFCSLASNKQNRIRRKYIVTLNKI